MTKNGRIAQLELQLEDEKRRYASDIESAKELAVVAVRVRETTEVLVRALSVRMLTTLDLLADFALFAWAVASGNWISLVAAGLFAVASWCVLHLKLKEKDDEERIVPP